MLFNCHCCAKSISTKMDHCPFCQTKTAKLAVGIEKATKQLESDSAFDRLKGNLSKIVWQISH